MLSWHFLHRQLFHGKFRAAFQALSTQTSDEMSSGRYPLEEA